MVTTRTINDIIKEYKESMVQSEAEVRSKLIVPLIDALGYPSYLRAEEFPVYGFSGGKRLPSTHGDFVLFSDREFALHRKFNQEDLDWVHQHSLLIFEAKKPDEMPELNGQPQFYTYWTKAVAYLMSDGKTIRGYYYNRVNSDPKIIDCPIDDLPSHDEFMNFRYEKILHIKEEGFDHFELIRRFAYFPERTSLFQNVGFVAEDDLKGFPKESFMFMRETLGENTRGLSDFHVMTRFLSAANPVPIDDSRPYSEHFSLPYPYETYEIRLYLNSDIFTTETGKVIEYFFDDSSYCIFEGQHISFSLRLKCNVLSDFDIGFHVYDKSISERVNGFDLVSKVLNSDTIHIVFEDYSKRSYVLNTKNPGDMWISKPDVIHMCDEYSNDIRRLKTIEDYYGISFKLHPVDAEDEIISLQEAIDMVYKGISLEENCEITLPGGIVGEDIVVDEPIVLKEDGFISLPAKHIFGFDFVPYKSWLLPGVVKLKGKTSKDVVSAPGCCTYKVLRNTA